jgi:hypothetical protein
MYSGSTRSSADFPPLPEPAERLAAKTCQLFRARARAIAAPNPPEAPVTNATCGCAEANRESDDFMQYLGSITASVTVALVLTMHWGRFFEEILAKR